MKRRKLHAVDGRLVSTPVRSRYGEENAVAHQMFCAHYFTGYSHPLMVSDIGRHPFYFMFNIVI